MEIYKNVEFSLFPKSKNKNISLVKKSSNKLGESNLYKYINENEKEYEINFISEENILNIDIKDLSTNKKFHDKFKIDYFIQKDKYFTLYHSISEIITLFDELIKENLFEIKIKEEEIILIFFIFNITKKEINFSIPKITKAFYNFLPKDYKSKKEEIKKEIYAKYILDSTKNNTKNNQNLLENIKDIINFSNIMKEEIEEEKKQNPKKFIEVEEAIKYPNSSSLYAIGVFASYLKNFGVNVVIEKENDDTKKDDEKTKSLYTCFKMLTSGLGLLKKYELKFDLDNKMNELLLENEEEAEKFLNSWKKIFSKEMSIPENKIIFFNPRKGSYIIDVIFIQQPAEDRFENLQNLPQNYIELVKITEKVLFDNCRLSQEILDSQYNKQLGTWNRSNTNRGNEAYNPPHDWLGFGLNTSKFLPDPLWIGKENIPGEWIVVYHGIRRGAYNQIQVVNLVCGSNDSHLVAGRNQACRNHIDIRHISYGNGKCNKCDRQFICVECNFAFVFDHCSNEEKLCNCRIPKRFKCNQCLDGVYCSPNIKVLNGYAQKFRINNSEEEYKIGFMCRADPKKIRQSQSVNDYYICSGEFDELRPYRILIKEMSIESIERWTNKKIKSIVFDSDIDNWNSGREFSQYIIGKSNLLFMIDDVENNRFGGYINSRITNSDIYINDPNAFIFSLKSNRRLNQPMKFQINSPGNAFISITTHERYIFAFGGGYDIKLDKKETSYMANSNPSSYNFGANINALYQSGDFRNFVQ